jgi:hypothetical protein
MEKKKKKVREMSDQRFFFTIKWVKKKRVS